MENKAVRPVRLGAFLLAWLFLGGCATFHGRSASSAKPVVVVVEGAAPIVNGDIAGARKASLDDAMKNALGLVAGVYVSQESVVSKVRLVEDTILTHTKGYLRRYSILRESQDNGFYRIAIKAEVCRDNRSDGPEPAPNPEPRALTVKISVDETVDGAPFSLCSVQNALKSKFAGAKFKVSESPDADIVITGKAAASRVSDAAAFGFVSYRTVLSLTAARRGSGEVIAVDQGAEGGVDITREAAANASLVNAAHRAARQLMEGISKAAQDHSVIRLTVSNVNSLDSLEIVLRSMRALPGVKDCRVRAFTGHDAHFELEAGENTAFDIARRMEKLSSGRILIHQVKPDGIHAICLYNHF